MKTSTIRTKAASSNKPATFAERQLKVAYIMSRFPKITETFILYEMLVLEQQGGQVEVYPLLRERTTLMHPEAQAFVTRAHFQPFLSWRILRAHVHFLRRAPKLYWQTLGTLLRANLGSWRFFTGALGIFPKSVYFAYLMLADGIAHLHVHFASHPAAAGFIIHRLSNIPYSFTAHGSDLHRDQHMLYEKVATAAFVVAISQYNKELIVSVCGEEFRDKIKVIHCGVDTTVFQPRAWNITTTAAHPALTIVCIGTLHEVKGQTYLLAACQRLHELGINFTCHLVGDGPDRAALTCQAAQLGLAERVQFHGQRTRDEIITLLQESDILVAPSVPSRDGRREGIPVVLMEAMASGVPVVASRISGIPELVEDGISGLLTPPGDVDALSEALQRLAHDRTLRQRLGQAGRAQVVQEFDLATNARLLAQSFRREA
jgi:colanic acid/amylovoran biosynthesis glycosyltransferase